MAGPAPHRLSDSLLKSVPGTFRAEVTATEPGLIAGLAALDPGAAPAPVGQWSVSIAEGQTVFAGDVILEIAGTAGELAAAEDFAMGSVGYASGLATAARRFAEHAPDGLRIICGGWKKLPAANKPLLRMALSAAGVLPRMIEGDFIYVDKNAVRLLGGISAAVAAGIAVAHGAVAIQVKTAGDVAAAARAGAGAIMVDTGKLDDLAVAHSILQRLGLRSAITLAYAGGVRLEDLADIRKAGADAVDVGRGILEAPLLDLRFDVVGRIS